MHTVPPGTHKHTHTNRYTHIPTAYTHTHTLPPDTFNVNGVRPPLLVDFQGLIDSNGKYVPVTVNMLSD